MGEPDRTSLFEGLLDLPGKELVLRTEVQHTNSAQEQCPNGLRQEWFEYSAVYLPGAPKRVLRGKLQLKTQELFSHIPVSVWNRSQHYFGPRLRGREFLSSSIAVDITMRLQGSM